MAIDRLQGGSDFLAANPDVAFPPGDETVIADAVAEFLDDAAR